MRAAQTLVDRPTRRCWPERRRLVCRDRQPPLPHWRFAPPQERIGLSGGLPPNRTGGDPPNLAIVAEERTAALEISFEAVERQTSALSRHPARRHNPFDFPCKRSIGAVTGSRPTSLAAAPATRSAGARGWWGGRGAAPDQETHHDQRYREQAFPYQPCQQGKDRARSGVAGSPQARNQDCCSH